MALVGWTFLPRSESRKGRCFFGVLEGAEFGVYQCIVQTLQEVYIRVL